MNLVWKKEDVPDSLRKSAGFLVPASEERMLTWCSVTSTVWPARSEEGYVGLRAVARGGPELLAMDEEEAFLTIWAELCELTSVRAAPVYRHVVRHAWALPDFDETHAARVWEIEALLGDQPGLGLAGSLWRGPGVSNVIESAARALKQVGGHPPGAALG